MPSQPWLSQDSAMPQGVAHWHRIGEGKPQFHFAAANGFPAKSYHFLLNRLGLDYAGISTDNRGMWRFNQQPPEACSWQDYADDIIAVLELNGVCEAQPIIGVGHSIGGALTVMAAAKRPELFSSLVLIDTATRPGRVVFEELHSGTDPMVSALEQATLQRRAVWASRGEFIAFLSGRDVYRGFSPQALSDYAQYGLLEQADGSLRLAYDPVWEARNFITTPNMWQALFDVTLPILFLYGADSFLYKRQELERISLGAKPGLTLDVIPKAGHLAVQDNPEATYALLKAWFDQQPDIG